MKLAVQNHQNPKHNPLAGWAPLKNDGLRQLG